ncbi:MAG: AAA family ATPase, partial [Bacteroides sp.]|nr:AAA family ATPase [Bacteroides sp.]
MASSGSDDVFLLRGYAGTGKTSLIGALVKTLNLLKQKVVLIAPTGRAAKVFSGYTGQNAYTIHKKIYRQKAFGSETGNFTRADNLHTHTLFIVDEASMISVNSYEYGAGSLLEDLIRYVYSGIGCKLLLMGDTAQLPPVGETESPALQADVLEGFGLQVTAGNLTEVVRQAHNSGILWNATAIRGLMGKELSEIFRIRFTGFPDIHNITGEELIDHISECYARSGMDETMVVCRSNKRANIYNNGIRNRILYREEELSGGDYIMIAKNSYSWIQEEKSIDFIANGDIAVVRRIRKIRELYGFRFADVLLRLPDYDDIEIEDTVLLDTLHSETSALSRGENEKLFYAVLEDYVNIPLKRDRMKKMKQDPHYNALQIKYAYAVTCHKAQGGQWENVFIDLGYLPESTINEEYYRWLYTAITRATGNLYLVNFPKDQLEE